MTRTSRRGVLADRGWRGPDLAGRLEHRVWPSCLDDAEQTQAIDRSHRIGSRTGHRVRIIAAQTSNARSPG